MPPYGLYPIPRHHLHGSTPRTRPVFNSQKFEDGDTEVPVPVPVPTTDTGFPQPQVGEGQTGDRVSEVKGKKKKKKNNRGKCRHSHLPGESESTVPQVAVSTPQATATPAISTPQAIATPAVLNLQEKNNNKEKELNENGTGAETSVAKKRKRAATNKTETPSKTLQDPTPGSFVVGGDMLQNLQSSMGNLGSSFGHVSTPTPVQSVEKRSKKRRKSGTNVEEQPTPNAAKEDVQPMSTKRAKKKARKNSNVGASTLHTPTKATASVPVTPVKETPVPLPSNVSMKSKKEYAPTHLSPSMSVDEQEPAFSSPAPQALRKVDIKSKSQTPLTTSNLMRYTQPLNDTPDAKPRSLFVASAATSVASSVSSMDVRGELTRANKPYSRSGAEFDPFVSPITKKSIRREFHKESDVTVFEKKYRKSQKTVNFSDETEYLDKHIEWQAENKAKGLLPCLGQATGCNSKREQVLRLSKEDPSNLLKVLVTTDSEHNALDEAKSRCTAAEYFLMMAVAARVPVPIGRMEGVWTLYCPNYSQIHVDKYGFGQRTLSIFSMPSPHDAEAYTARLSIPPRSMLYSVLSFAVPPHASFRTITVKTSAEGYKMQLVFLGNGYLQLRVDLNLLLRGKPTETAEGKPMYMEFIGVHEQAVQWKQKEDELEIEGRKLFAKYDGV
jgi:hypothetical protein